MTKEEFETIIKPLMLLNGKESQFIRTALLGNFQKWNKQKQLTIPRVMFELPDTKEIESRLKHVVDESFEDYEVVEKREYSLGFRACFNWLKINQLKSKGN